MSRERHPEVIYLPAIFREIREGRIRIPAFQRGYVWDKSDGLELLDSVKKQYPIGSVLFWEADVGSMKTDYSDDLPFPNPRIDGSVDFILDGMQRISTLYGAFHERDGIDRKFDSFAASYDLREETFVAVRDENSVSIDLRTLFVPQKLLGEQARLSKEEDGEILVSRTIDLHRRFQEYLVPVIRISGQDTAKVVQIFERVNSTGTRLGAVDFMRALTWHQDFDLTEELASLSLRLERLGWKIPQPTIAKAIAVHLGVVPKIDEMMKLREFSPKDLISATRKTEQAVSRAIEFLSTDIGICSYDYVPYEAQFLVLVQLANKIGAAKAMPEWVPHWFWTSGFSEWFFGKPDSSVARLIEETTSNPEVAPHVQFRLTADTVMRRVQKRGGAVAMTMTAALAQQGRSLLSGKDLPSREMLRGYGTESVVAVFASDELEPWFGKRPRTDKFVANVVLLAPDERATNLEPEIIRDAILRQSSKRGGLRVLASQGIDKECLSAIERGDCEAFLRSRARQLVDIARQLSGASE